MGGIRVQAAAQLLGVSPSTLRSWEERFGYPSPNRTPGGHRQYELSELQALRQALLENRDIASAIEAARGRGEGMPGANALVEAFDRFDERAADRVLEESLAVRSLERSIEEILLPGLELAERRTSREPEYDFGCRWAAGWLHATRRLTPPATRDDGVLLFDATSRLGVEELYVQALEVALRRAGYPVLLLRLGLEEDRIVRALRGLDPALIVLAGPDATLEVLKRLLSAVRTAGSQARVAEYREAMPVSGSHGVPSLGRTPSQAIAALGRPPRTRSEEEGVEPREGLRVGRLPRSEAEGFAIRASI